MRAIFGYVLTSTAFEKIPNLNQMFEGSVAFGGFSVHIEVHRFKVTDPAIDKNNGGIRTH